MTDYADIQYATSFFPPPHATSFDDLFCHKEKEEKKEPA